MASRAPVSGDQSVRDAFKKADTDSKFAYLQLGINFETQKFVVLNYQQNEEQKADDIVDSMVKSCKEKEHTYFIIRDPTKQTKKFKDDDSNDKGDEDNANRSFINLYILIHYAPDLSPVKTRMMYASSRPSLKAFFGNSSFSEDYHCSTIEELSLKKIIEARTLHHNIDFRSDAEIEKEAANLETSPTSATSQVMKSLPIDMKENAKSAIESYKNESCKCVFLKLDGSTQAIEGEEQKCESIADIRKLLVDNEPRYILFWFEDKQAKKGDEEEKEEVNVTGPQRIFGYFCPEKANRKLKFTYSTCKNNVIDYCRAMNLEFFQKVEMSLGDEMNSDYLNYHIFPVKEKKEQFAMPKAPKSKRKSKTKKRKKINVDDL